MPNTLIVRVRTIAVPCPLDVAAPTPHAAPTPVLPRPKPKWGGIVMGKCREHVSRVHTKPHAGMLLVHVWHHAITMAMWWEIAHRVPAVLRPSGESRYCEIVLRCVMLLCNSVADTVLYITAIPTNPPSI